MSYLVETPEHPGGLWSVMAQTWFMDLGSGASSLAVKNSSLPILCSLCDSKEGWGPIAGADLHVTRCFIEGIVLNAPNAVAILFSLIQLIQMSRVPSKFQSAITLKLLSQFALIAIQVLTFGYTAFSQYSSDALDVSALTPIVSIVALVIVTALTYKERNVSNIASGSLLFFWLFQIVALISALVVDSVKTTPSLYILAGSAVLSFILEWWPRNRSVYQEFVDARHNNPVDQADIFSRFTFSWMTPLMKKGFESYLTADDLPELPASERTDDVTERLLNTWENELGRVSRPNLYKVLFWSFGGEYTVGGVAKAIQDVMAFTQPQLLRMLISFVTEYTESDGKTPLVKGFYISAGMFAVSIIQTMFLHQYFERAFTTGMRVRTSLTSMIFRKSLRLSNEAKAERTVGDTVNLMSVDTQRLQDLCPNGHIIWSAPFQIVLCLVSLHGLLGNSMWAGVIVMIVLIPFNSYLNGIQKKNQQENMKAKDLRTRLTSELFSSIKSIKLYAWEIPFKARLQDARENKELASQRTMTYFGSFMTFMWSFAPFLVSFSTFALHTFISDKPLTSDIVFPAISLFNLLQFPLAMFPMLMLNFIQSTVAVQRITDFLLSDELQKTAVTRLPASTAPDGEAVVVKDASFLWRMEPEVPAATDLNLVVKKGSLTCVVGRVGAGKTTLLTSILGDLHKTTGEVTVRGTIAYVAQNSWIFNGSVKENIIFGLEYNEELYKATIHACALTDDLKVLSSGDDTVVGEKGISLSGGQKARVTLARAVYSRADVYLLDDVLSAVDEHVGRHIIKHVLSSETGLLAKSAVILATNSIPVLKNATEIVMVSDGRIIEKGSYHEAIAANNKIGQLLTEFGTVNKSEGPSGATSVEISRSGTPQAEESSQGKTVKAVGFPRPPPAAWKRSQPLEVRKEQVEQGKVSWDVYLEYARVCGPHMVALFIFTLISSLMFLYGANVWLKYWSDQNTAGDTTHSPVYYLAIYGLIGITGACFIVSQGLVLWLGCAIPGSRKLHNAMLDAVIRAPMSFFETTPLGRIINRFSSDVSKVDLSLGVSFFQMLNSLVRILFTLGLIVFSTPEFLVIVTPLAFVYYWYQLYYIATSRELKRLESVSKSPIFTQFQEALDGISTLRAYGQQNRFVFVNENYLDGNNQAFFPSVNANRWLAVRLEFFGSLIIVGAAVLSVVSLPSGRLSAGMIGLALSYALSITQSLNWLVRMTVDVETNIVSVERMLEYTRLTPEAPEIVEGHRPGEKWPENGKIEIVDYSTRYREDLPLVLKNISLDIKPGEKIGIVGRTGAGKSSLSLALFRLIEGVSGEIDIDDVNTSEIGLYDLRSNLSIIPQDAQLFQGTVRNNLDPNERYTDADLWRALEISHLKAHVESMDGGLEAAINEGGSNLSSGQRQLICLARAILTKTKVLVLDEATASVDVQTDQLVQSTIRDVFKDRTILTIAHRLNTIMDSDRIVVLSFGEVAEFDTPQNLLKNPNSLFASLAAHGELDE